MGKTIKSWTRPDGSKITELEVPSSIAGIRVNKISAEAFKGIDGISKISVAASNAEELPGAPWGAVGVEVKYRKAPVGPTPGGKLPLGGRIFYDDGDNGATYKFYDASGNEIAYSGANPETVLANATQYEVSGTPTKDRFYVFDNTSHTTGNRTATNGLVTNIYWGYYNKTTGATTNTIGSGKTNTNKILGITDTSEYKDGIFKYIKACNDENLNGCNDWYIGSNAEQDKLREVASTFGITWWYTSKCLWSSVEYSNMSASHAYIWNYTKGDWRYYNKYDIYNYYGCLAMRSF